MPNLRPAGDVSTTELRQMGFPLNRARKRLHPRAAHAEAMRVRRLQSTRRTVMGNRCLWYPQVETARELPITRRHRPRWVREYLAHLGIAVRIWPRPPLWPGR